MPHIHILNGPNLHLLGKREQGWYGNLSLNELHDRCIEYGDENGMSVTCAQHNHEGHLVEAIGHLISEEETCGLVINAAAYTHTSIAIADAISALKNARPEAVTIIEVHLSNVFAREEFRHHSYISTHADGVICGLGLQGYLSAIDAIIGQQRNQKP